MALQVALALALPTLAVALRTDRGVGDVSPTLTHPLPAPDADICVINVPSANHSNPCKFISQGLCERHRGGYVPAHLTGGHQNCMRKLKTCAIVGSSAHLLNATYGALIDEHEAVIRMNSAPAGGEYGTHVGNRTDYRFINSEGYSPPEEAESRICYFLHEPEVNCGRYCWQGPDWCGLPCKDYPEGNYWHKACAQQCNLKKLKCKTASQKEERSWGSNFVFMDLVHSSIARQMVGRPTAGMKAVAFALRQCEQLSVFGFGHTCEASEMGSLLNSGARYYKNGVMVHTWHSYNEELELLQRADTMGPSVFLKPEDDGKWLATKRVTVNMPACAKRKAPRDDFFTPGIKWIQSG